MLLCSLTECVTFFLGTLTEMPAIEEFAYAAALAILFDFLFQITLFLAVLSLDARRLEVRLITSFFWDNVDKIALHLKVRNY